MTLSRIIGLVLFAVLCVLIWQAYENIGEVRRHVRILWEFRYLVLGVVVFLGLSIVQWVWGKISDRLATPEGEEDST
jgi:hypothetical protein